MSTTPSIHSVSGPYRAHPTNTPRVSQQQSAPAAGSNADSVQLSPMARWMQKLETLPPVRRHLVDVVRAELEDGRYETPERLDRAVDALADELF